MSQKVIFYYIIPLERGVFMLKRICIYIIGVLILGLGIVLNTKTGLGVAAINSLPYALSEMTAFTLGTWTTIVYIVFIVIQLCIYRKIDFKVVLQFPFSYVMGIIIDFYNQTITYVPSSYFIALILLGVAVILTALGAYLVVSMDLVANPADGMVSALGYLCHYEFGKMKMIFDCFMVALTTILSLFIAHHTIGIGIGTIVSMFAIGRLIMVYTRYSQDYLRHIVNESI